MLEGSHSLLAYPIQVLGGKAGHSACPLPAHSFWPFPLMCSGGSGRGKQKEADPNSDLLQSSKLL